MSEIGDPPQALPTGSDLSHRLLPFKFGGDLPDALDRNRYRARTTKGWALLAFFITVAAALAFGFADVVLRLF